MATGVEPRDSDFDFTRDDLDRLSDAFKNKEFRKMLADYCDEMIDPKRVALYQKEMTQLEKERGMDIVFINPEPGYVIKTSVAGLKKAFVNVCTNDNVGKPSYFARDNDKGHGLEWQIPYSLASPHEDYDKKRAICVVYDVVFHPNTLKFADKFPKFKKLVNKTACDALESNFSIKLDKKNVRFPKLKYKGHPIPTVIRTPDPSFKPSDETQENDPQLIDELYPQQCYPPPSPEPRKQPNRRPKQEHSQSVNDTSPYTIPKYIMKQQRDVDIQEFTFEKMSKKYTAIPSNIILQINLPLLSSTVDCKLDVKDKCLSLVCEKPAKYKLNVDLPYRVSEDCGSAKFDKTRHLLIVTLPVVKNIYLTVDLNKQDSGVESDNNSCSDEDNLLKNTPLITEFDSPVIETPSDTTNVTPSITVINPPVIKIQSKTESTDFITESLFLDSGLLYSLPSYTVNSLDDTIAFTFHIKNVEPDSVLTNCLLANQEVQLKFTSIGAGFFPVYYAAFVSFPSGYSFEEVSAEAWDNNVILQVKMPNGRIPDSCYVGSDKNCLKHEILGVIRKNVGRVEKINTTEVAEKCTSPVVDVVLNKNDEVSISVTSNYSETIQGVARDIPKVVNCTTSASSGNGSYKGILRHPSHMTRSLSESSVDCRDFSSSIDCISSDCIPEESSFKKTVRFNDVIAKQVFRSNSSILGQKKKNQRKSRNKKKSLERRLSESEPDEPTQTHLDAVHKSSTKKSKLRSIQHTLDSGYSETSDGDAPKEGRGQIHMDKFYDPDKLNKGKYQEVAFKNDLIFDLDI